MILTLILIITVITAIMGITNLYNKRLVSIKSISLKKQMPGNLPIIALSNNGKVYNFILDSGSNISHICAEYYESIDSIPIGTYKEGEISGLNGASVGITMCSAIFKDVTGYEYSINLSISDHLSKVAKNIESSTGVPIHGLLGTDFFINYNYVLDFKTLEVYPLK